MTATAAFGVFWFMHATAQIGPTVPVRPLPASPSVSDAAQVSTNPMAQLHTTIAASSEVNKVPADAVIATLPDASEGAAIPAAVANPVVPVAETIPATHPPEPSREPQAPLAGESAPVTDRVPTVPAAQVEAPTQPALVPSITTPPAAPEPLLAIAVAPIPPQPEPATTGSASSPATQPARVRLPAGEIATLLARGDALFGVGDIASARLFYERAAQGGDAQAALRLGESYDSVFLARARLNGVSGDAAAAAQWYRYARELGAPGAEALFTRGAASDETTKRPKEMNRLLFERFLARQGGQTR